MSEINEYQRLSQTVQEIVHLFYEYTMNPEKTVIQPLFQSEIKKAMGMSKKMSETIHVQVQEFHQLGADLLGKHRTKDQFEKLRRKAEKLILELKEL